LTLVIVTFGLFLDHWLTVLEFNDREVVVADPLSGEARLSREEFRARWRFIGITLQRAPPGR
jgi:ABC-type bacteriocin/lantibiotic exporter with double-glycine peptidase domain